MKKRGPRCGAKRASKSKCATHSTFEHFCPWDVQTLHRIVSRNPFRNQKWLQLTVAEHIFKLWGRGAKHISKSKCEKHTTFGPLLDVHLHHVTTTITTTTAATATATATTTTSTVEIRLQLGYNYIYNYNYNCNYNCNYGTPTTTAGMTRAGIRTTLRKV